MSITNDRRNFLKNLGTAGILTGTGLYTPFAIGGSTKKVVIIGGGIGGATAAKYIKKIDPQIKVTLIESNAKYYTCFGSNQVLSGDRSMDDITFSYESLKKRGVEIIIDTVIGVDQKKRQIITSGKQLFNYDRCIVAPGIDFIWDDIEGLNQQISNTTIPHAWKAGAQTSLLRKQLVTMKNGGTVIISVPPNPFRCPAGPYERVSQIAYYLKNHKPKSKIIILDSKDKFSKFNLFIDGWTRHYGYNSKNSLINWVPANKGGTVASVNSKKMIINTNSDTHKADVINIIPKQKAGKIASVMGLTNASNWCPVHGDTFESTIHKNIHVIGDSALAMPLPKSAYVANSEAKVCAIAVVSLLNNFKIPDPSYINTCYSVIAPDDAISVTKVYKYSQGKIIGVAGSGGLTPREFNSKKRAREVENSYSWYKNITSDTFG